MGSNATNFELKPGFILAKFYKGIGKSGVFISYAIWESPKHFKNTTDKILGPDLHLVISKFPDNFAFFTFIQKNCCS
jgi:hypothetical protein